MSVTTAHGWRTKLPFFYGWVVVASTFVTMALSWGVHYSFSVFYVALLEQFNWGRAATAGVFSTFVLFSSITGVGAGVLVDRFGPTRIVPAGGLLLAVGLLATSQLSELWQFYLCFGVLCGSAMAISGWVPGVALVSRWFQRKRGLAIGVASAGVGLGTVLMVPLSQYLISGFGWQWAYLALAGIILLGIAPQSTVFQVGRPEELGLKPDGVQQVSEASKRAPGRRLVVVDQAWASHPWTLGSAITTSRFWLLTLSLILSAFTNQMLWAHQAAFLVDAGYEKMLAASTVGMAGLVSIALKILWGEAGDRIGRERTFTLGAGCVLLSILLLMLTARVHTVWLVILFAAAFGTGYAVNPPLLSAAAADIFAGKNFGAIYGAVWLGQGIGGAVGAWAAGSLFDSTGSYTAALLAAALSTIAGVLCMWLAAPRQVRRMAKSTEC